jgi:DNA (cytosine-5)-methyltransferase 1
MSHFIANSDSNSDLDLTPSQTRPNTHTTTYIDLFCGIGSFHRSFDPLGWECVMACDINPDAQQTYQTNYGLTPKGDITAIDPTEVPPFDVLCAGFPCQPFSQCGQHRGFDDARGTMFFHLMKFVHAHHPRAVVLENVRGLLAHDGGKTFARIVTELQQAGYVVQHKVITCSDYGLPQMRKRLIIVGCLSSDPLATYADQLLQFDDYRRHVSLSDLLHRPFEKEMAYTIRCGGRNSALNDRHNWDGYRLTDGSEYRLSIDDCLAIQGFGRDFQLCGSATAQWKQLGNTIPTVFTEIIGKNLHKYMGLSASNTDVHNGR